MVKRIKCPHCGKVADFHQDSCTLCWAHRVRGPLGSEEQIAQARERYRQHQEQAEWQARFDRWQKVVIGPAVLLTISSIAWAFSSVGLCWGLGVSWVHAAPALVSVMGFPLGGFWVGGSKWLRPATILLVVAGLTYGWSVVEMIMSDLELDSLKAKDLIWYAIQSSLCAAVLWGSVQIFRLKPRPGAAAAA